jgi:hypothetical protein
MGGREGQAWRSRVNLRLFGIGCFQRFDVGGLAVRDTLIVLQRLKLAVDTNTLNVYSPFIAEGLALSDR